MPIALSRLHRHLRLPELRAPQTLPDAAPALLTVVRIAEPRYVRKW
jgi:hypothetical protein